MNMRFAVSGAIPELWKVDSKRLQLELRRNVVAPICKVPGSPSSTRQAPIAGVSLRDPSPTPLATWLVKFSTCLRGEYRFETNCGSREDPGREAPR